MPYNSQHPQRERVDLAVAPRPSNDFCSCGGVEVEPAEGKGARGVRWRRQCGCSAHGVVTCFVWTCDVYIHAVLHNGPDCGLASLHKKKIDAFLLPGLQICVCVVLTYWGIAPNFFRSEL